MKPPADSRDFEIAELKMLLKEKVAESEKLSEENAQLKLILQQFGRNESEL